VIGTADVISNVTKRVLSSYHRQMYAGGNVVIAAAGNVEHNKLVRMLQRAQSQQRPPAGGPRVRRPLVKPPPPGLVFAKKNTELLKKLNDGLAKAIADGTVARIYAQFYKTTPLSKELRQGGPGLLVKNLDV
jgi:predicted Zn-dependent peptidase